jgi:NOL1/NOP2/fmu family ribosome biogenesis protein
MKGEDVRKRRLPQAVELQQDGFHRPCKILPLGWRERGKRLGGPLGATHTS